MLKNFFTYLFTSAFFISSLFAQYTPKDSTGKVVTNDDSVIVKVHHKHSANLAMAFSACVPGLGQAYNKKYWKIPIVYAMLGTTIYFYKYNDKYYKQFKQAYLNRTDSIKGTVDAYKDFPDSWLLEQEKSFRRYRDLNIILTALAYTLNVVDAYVDAQFMDFDVSDNLSMHVTPAFNFQPSVLYPNNTKLKTSAGLMLTLRF